jgi:hypothetical protein
MDLVRELLPALGRPPLINPDAFIRPRNARAWAIGRETRTGFVIRRVVWGRLMARFERREDETILRAFITIAPKERTSSK